MRIGISLGAPIIAARLRCGGMPKVRVGDIGFAVLRLRQRRRAGTLRGTDRYLQSAGEELH
jgi:hypothetical protein